MNQSLLSVALSGLTLLALFFGPVAVILWRDRRFARRGQRR